MQVPTTSPTDIPVPDRIESVGRWGDGYRDIFGFDRTITDHPARVYSLASQRADGAIDLALVVVARGEEAAFEFNSDQARELAAALLQTAGEIDGWMAK